MSLIEGMAKYDITVKWNAEANSIEFIAGDTGADAMKVMIQVYDYIASKIGK